MDSKNKWDELEEAWSIFIYTIAKKLGIIKLLDWLAKRLE